MNGSDKTGPDYTYISDEMKMIFGLNDDPHSEERLRVAKFWQPMFPENIIKLASSDKTQSKLKRFSYSWAGCYAYYYPDSEDYQRDGETSPARGTKKSNLRSGYGYNAPYEVQIHKSPRFPEDNWHSSYLSCSCDKAEKGQVCVHEAALLYYWQQRKGGLFVAEETEWQHRERLIDIRLREKEEELRQLREECGTGKLDVLDFFKDRKDPEGLLLYDMRAALSHYETDAYNAALARKALENKQNFVFTCTEDQSRDGKRTLRAILKASDSADQTGFIAGRVTLNGNRLVILEQKEGYLDANGVTESEEWVKTLDGKKGVLYANGIVLCSLLWDYADGITSGAKDLTDSKATLFFKFLESSQHEEEEKIEIPEEPRSKQIRLMPRIIIEEGNARLSFKIQRNGERAFVLRNLENLIDSYSVKTKLVLSKTGYIDFESFDFTEESQKLYDFIQRRVGEVSYANDRLLRKSTWTSATMLSVTSALELKGALLDGFYDAWEGENCEYTDKTNGIKEELIPVGHRKLVLNLSTERLQDIRGTFAGIAVQGLIPVLLKGSGSHRYTLDKEGLSRITKEERDAIRPFDKVSDDSGYFRLQVGLNHLQEFYYRVVPSFISNPNVRFEDSCEEEAETHLPPEPHFDFWLDCEEPQDITDADTKQCIAAYARKKQKNADAISYLLTMRADVSYDDQKYSLRLNSQNEGYRDAAQEQRVVKAVQHFLPMDVPDSRCFAAVMTDEEMFDFLRGGIAVLEKYGNVHGTEAFRIHNVRAVPTVKVGISVNSSIMDLTVTSADLREEELLEVLDSYRRRKRFHKLRSGDYLDLAGDNQILEISRLMNGLDLDPKTVIEKGAKIPLYRALYLDKLLAEHDSIATSRDRIYRGLVRNFGTVKDSETEPPEQLRETLRPYQNYGFKWIKTLEDANFGGILADEMGLGKTLEMISVLSSDYQEANLGNNQEFNQENKDNQDEKDGTIKKADKDEKTTAAENDTNDSRDRKAPSLIVCPASLVYNWQEEFRKFAPELKTCPITGGAVAFRKLSASWDEMQVYIISYDLLKRNIAQMADRKFYYVILDEAQYIKNAGAAAAKSVKALDAEHRFALTGTPIENRLSELWSIFDFLMPGFLYGRKDFEQKLELPIIKNKDEEATEKLRRMTGPFILRRRKEEVLKDLPSKLEEVRYVPVTGEQQRLYDAQVLRVRNAIGEQDGNKGRIQVFAELTKIREICCDPSLLFENYKGESAKREALMGLIRQAIDGDHRMLVFSQFTSMLALLERDLLAEGIPYYVLTGSTPKEKRIQMVHDFNEGDVPVFLISLKAGGTGLNLTGADVVIHYDPWWNLAAQNQATDRAHRIGQTKQVTVYRLIMKDTIEERILELQETKKDLADSVLEGNSESLSSLSREELLELLG